MTKIDKKQVVHIAKLANLDVTEDDLEEYAPQLQEVVEYIGQLEEVVTKDIDPTSQTTGLMDKTRKDRVNEQRILSQESATSQAAAEHENYFTVPMVLTEKDLT